MSTVADYVGRTIDVLAYDGAVPAGEVLLEQIMAQPGEGGKIATGMQKLAQRFILELFTETGSQLYFPNRGTEAPIPLLPRVIPPRRAGRRAARRRRHPLPMIGPAVQPHASCSSPCRRHPSRMSHDRARTTGAPRAGGGRHTLAGLAVKLRHPVKNRPEL